MPTYQDYNLLNSGFDSLTGVLLKRRMMQQQEEERAAAQRTADERTGIMQQEIKQRSAARVKLTLADPDGTEMEYDGPPEGLNQFMQASAQMGKPLHLTNGKSASAGRYGTLAGTLPGDVKYTLHAASPEQFDELVRKSEGLPKAPETSLEVVKGPPGEKGFLRLGNQLHPFDNTEKPSPQVRTTVIEERVPTTTEFDGKPDPEAGQMRVKSRSYTGPRDAVEAALLKRSLTAGASGAPAGGGAQPKPVPKDRKQWVVGKAYVSPKGVVAVWNGNGFVPVK